MIERIEPSQKGVDYMQYSNRAMEQQANRTLELTFIVTFALISVVSAAGVLIYAIN